MSSGSGTVRGMPAGAGVVGGDAVVHVGTRAGIVVGIVVVVDTVQIGRRIRLSTCGTQSSQTIVVVIVVVGIRRTSCALRCVVAVYRRCWLG